MLGSIAVSALTVDEAPFVGTSGAGVVTLGNANTGTITFGTTSSEGEYFTTGAQTYNAASYSLVGTDPDFNASSENIQFLDGANGITLATGDRILLKNQSTGSQNGIYTVNASGAPTRATDFDEDSEVTGGTFFFVEEGTTNADNGFVMTNDGTVTVGSTALVFTQFSGAGQVIAGAALTKSGNTLNVGVDDSSIEVNSDALRVKASGITNAMLAGSIDLTAKVTGALPVGNGGTGLSSIAKGSVLVANSANTLSALDGGGSNDGILTYTASSDTIAFATAVDGGTFT